MKKRILALLLSLAMLPVSAAALTVDDARMLVEKLYINEVSEEVLGRATVEEIFAGLDEYSAYFTPEEYAAFLDTMNDVVMVGIGIVSVMNEEGSGLVVEQVLPGGAAEAGGIQVGDTVLAVDGKAVTQAQNSEEVVGWITGEEGTLVTLKLLRATGEEEMLTLTRKPFTIPHTAHELLDGHIGYIDCDSFGNETYPHFAEAVEEYAGVADRWIVDLRSNSGGLTSAAAQVAGIFTGAGNQVLLRERSGQYYGFAASGELTTLYPAVFLVNEYSASSAELLAAAVRAGGGGPVIGSRTFGKGVAQTMVDRDTEPEIFADGDAVRITSARFYSPNGAVNDKVGVIPNLMVDDRYASDIAWLLCYDLPSEQENEGVLRIHTGGWRLYVDTKQALEEESGALKNALEELLEAIWPEEIVYWGSGEGKWERLYAGEVAALCGLEEYTPRVFEDVEETHFGYAMNVLKTCGILRGKEDGKADPKGTLTRAELCALLAQALNYTREEESVHFEDVDQSAWYAPAVNAMAELGFVKGDENTLFHPQRVMTCEELIVVLERVGAWMSVNLYESRKAGPEDGALEEEALAAYSDWAKESAWLLGRAHKNVFGQYISYIWDAVDLIQPQTLATREQAAYSLYRIMDIIGLLYQ